MTLTLLVALVLQGLSLILLRNGLHGTWLQRPFPLMVIAATVYHGLDELLMLDPGISSQSPFRSALDPSVFHWGAFLMSCGILASVVGYLLALGTKGRNARPDLSGLAGAMRIIDWRVLAVLIAPLAAATYSGQGYNNGTVLDSRTSSTVTVLAASFFLTTLILATFSFVWKHGARSFVPAMAVQSVLMAAAGQRLEIIISAITVCSLLAMVGMRPKRRQVLWLAAIGGVCVMAITSVRATQGRDLFYTDTGLGGRVSAIAGSLFSGGPPTAPDNTSPGFLTQAALRFDTNEWAGSVAYSMSQGRAPEGLGALWGTMREAIPSALDPGKNDTSVIARSSEAEQDWYFGLSSNDQTPGHYGLWLGLAGPWLYAPVMALVGFLLGLLERWVLRRVTAARLIWFVLFALGGMFVERGIPSMVDMLRYGIPLGMLAFGLQTWWPRVRQERVSTRPDRIRAAATRRY